MGDIRTLLAEITAQDVSLHPSLIEELRKECAHSISHVETEDTGLPKEYMCFEYALGLVRSKEYLGIMEHEYSIELKPIGADGEFIEFILDNVCLEEVAPDEALSGYLVIYFKDSKPKHAGILVVKGRIRSKWGKGHLFEHLLFEAPAIYGTEVRCYRPPDLQICEDFFIQYAESKGRKFTTEVHPSKD
jgi:hypothetical protein